MTHIRFVLALSPKKSDLSAYPLEDLKNWGPSCSVEKARECLVLMAQLEDQILGMQEVLKSPDFEHRLEQQLKMSLDPQSKYPYWKDAPWTENVAPRVAAILDLIKLWNISPMDDQKNPCFFRKDTPLPRSVLRVTPEV